jgi:hypothetical protein
MTALDKRDRRLGETGSGSECLLGHPDPTPKGAEHAADPDVLHGRGSSSGALIRPLSAGRRAAWRSIQRRPW